MAFHTLNLVVATTVFISYCSQQELPFDQTTISTCVQDGKYFDSNLMKCSACDSKSNLVPNSKGLGCRCKNGFKTSISISTKLDVIKCEKCQDNQVVSADGFDCLTCNKDTTDATECEPCGTAGYFYFVEDYGNTSVLQKTCKKCLGDTKATDGRCVPCRESKIFQKSCDCGTGTLYKDRCLDRMPPLADRKFSVYINDALLVSPYLTEHTPLAAFMCSSAVRNMTACKHLANLCVLQYLSLDREACNEFRDVSLAYVKAIDQSAFQQDIPWLYIKGNGQLILGINSEFIIDTKFGFKPTLPSSKLKFVLATFDITGEFLGWQTVTGGFLQLCSDTDTRLDAAYQFGTIYTQQCQVSAVKLFDKNLYAFHFYELYLEVGPSKLQIIPVKILNLKHGDGTNPNTAIFNGAEDRIKWVLIRRFFFVDNRAFEPTSGGTKCGSSLHASTASVARYPKSISFHLKLRESSGDKGFIHIPYMEIEYASVKCSDALDGETVEVDFKMKYTMDEEEYDRNFKIGAGTIGTLMTLYAAYRTWVWFKRAGRLNIDFPAIIHFVFQVSGALSNAFFVLTFGTSFYWLVFYKNQEYAVVVLPEEWAYINFLALLGTAFALKLLYMAYILFMQCSADIFLIDWERPRATANVEAGHKKSETTVSVWRTYFVANEFNELQSSRRLSVVIQILVVVFFLEVVGFVNVSTMDGNGTIFAPTDEYHAPQSHIFRYAVATLVYIIVAFVQWVVVVWIYNQFIEDPVHSFVDLCSMCNVSVFIMANSQYGYYVHGRSVHGKGDADLKEMHEMMKREEEDLCGQRGLLPNQEEQTFEMSLPWKLRAKYDQMYLPVALHETPSGRGDAKNRIMSSDKTVTAYINMNKFLSAFLDHSLREIDYMVKDKSLMEKVLNTEFLDTNEKGVFYHDNGRSFTDIFFYGNELTLIMFDLLCFSVVDLIATNYVLSGIVTYLFSKLLIKIREMGGRRNLARKTMVDERFLI